MSFKAEERSLVVANKITTQQQFGQKYIFLEKNKVLKCWTAFQM